MWKMGKVVRTIGEAVYLWDEVGEEPNFEGGAVGKGHSCLFFDVDRKDGDGRKGGVDFTCGVEGMFG